MKTQIEFLKEIIDLKKDNKEMDIIFLLDNDVINYLSDFTLQEINRIEIRSVLKDDNLMIIDNENIINYIKSTYNTNDPKTILDKYNELTSKNICVFFEAT